jgi:hypothetical protein
MKSIYSRKTKIRKRTNRRRIYKTKRKRQLGGVAPCVPCAAAALSNPIGAGIAVAGACTYGAVKAYKCLKKKLTKKKKKKKKKKNKK